jgi:Glycosyltransferase (GlcNAc)
MGVFFAVWFLLIGYLHVHIHTSTPTTRNGAVPAMSIHALQVLPSVFQPQRRTMTPLTISEITDYLSQWISQLHQHLQQSDFKKGKEQAIWTAFHNLTINTLYPWDQQYLQRMPLRRQDGSIFLSVASYRDENCLNTMLEAYRKAKDPNKLFVGLVQQNCQQDCYTGIMKDGKSRLQPNPDPDCHGDFCASAEGKPFCEAHQVRTLHIQESESLGPYMARYFASKLWNGEEWFMQVDSHMTFAQDWDAISIKGLKKAPSSKPVRLFDGASSHIVV